jgi:hypothetical protein
LRCTLYHSNNAVQSVLVELTIASRRTADLPEDGLHAVVDYSLSDDLAAVGHLGPRRLNVLTNDGPGATHTLVVKGEDATAVAVSLTEAGAQEVLRAVRDQLTVIMLGRDGQTSEYDDDNSADVRRLINDLKTLAHFGSMFWEQAVPSGDDQDALRRAMPTTQAIQVARVTSTVFPWAVVYDLPHLFGDPWEPCRLLREWPDAQEALRAYPAACPHAREHELNTLCPFGLWGFRHLIEQPPSVRRGQLRTSLAVPDGAAMATVRSLRLDERVTAGHLAALEACLNSRFALNDCDSRDDFLAAIGEPALPLIYFYCHGRVAKVGDEGVDLRAPYLEIGMDDMLGTGDLNAWAAAGKWDRQRWRDVPPLVFINGCHTATLSPEQLVSFVEAFAAVEAAGVIGTEIAVAQPVASELAQRFFEHLLSAADMTVGVALRRARLDMLAKGNVAGLVYTAFCSMDLALAAS